MTGIVLAFVVGLLVGGGAVATALAVNKKIKGL